MSDNAQRKGAWALWIGVTILFLLIIGAWATLITIASKNPTETIDVETNAQHSTSNTER